MTKLALALLVLSTSVFAADVSLNLEGKFKRSYPIGVFYPSKADCKADGGKYSQGMCFMNGGITTEVKKVTDGTYSVSMGKVGTNLHMCDFSAEATNLNDVQLKASVKNEYSDTTCEVELRYTNKNTLSVVTNGECNDFCGANLGLDTEDLVRTK